MSSNVESSTPGLWSGGLVIALLISIGLIGWVQLPFKPDRPPEPREGLGYAGIQDVDARLWQDPFAAVEAARKEARAASSRCWTIGERDRGMPVLKPSACEEPFQTDDPPPRSCKQFIQGMEIRIETVETVRILAVMVSGGPSSGAAEARRRERYAILSGLMLEEFEPEDAEHVGYFELEIQGLPGYVPYEWLKRKPHSPFDETQNLVLLWLDEDGFRAPRGGDFDTQLANKCNSAAQAPEDKLEKPQPPEDGLIQRMSLLLEKLRDSNPAVRIDVMGPANSTTLQHILDPKTSPPPTKSPFENLWSPKATIPIDASCLQNWIDTSGIVLHRTIADDASLAKLLVDELKKRRLKDAANIALVGQLDTAYSRSLRDAVQQQWCEARYNEKPDSELQECLLQSGSEDPVGECMEICKREFVSFGYLRGLDGQTPGASAAAESASKSASVERATGDAQIDYLRRMRDALLIQDKALRSKCSVPGRFSRKCGIQAIGVLGNDYYDKLLVLQALKPAFPNAVFFTTDVEADMWHPEHNPYTRNLIVASGFGLTLGGIYQQSVPPLRNSYQAASLLTTRLVARSPVNQRLKALQSPPPRLFEIGRTQAIDLRGPEPYSDNSSSSCCVENAHPEEERERFYLGPFKDDKFPRTILRLVAAALLLGGLLLFAVVGRDRMLFWVGINPSTGDSGDQSFCDLCATWSFLCANWYSRLAITVVVGILPVVAILWGPLPAVLAALIGAAILIYWMVPKQAEQVGQAKRAWLLFVLGVGALLAVAGFFMFVDLTNGGEPFSILEGVSIWPSEIIRVLAGLLAIFFFVRAFRAQELEWDTIGSRFFPGTAEAGEAGEAGAAGAAGEAGEAATTDGECGDLFPNPPGKSRPAWDIWKTFRLVHKDPLRDKSMRATLARIAPEMLLFLLLAMVLMLAFGMPNRPARSLISFGLDFGVIMVVLIPFLGLLFLMVDSTKRTLKLADALSGPVSWPPETLKAMNLARYIKEAGQSADVVWLDVKLIAEVTRPVGDLVWYPMWVLLLLIAARHPVFDAWSMPAAWVVVVGATALYAAGCAWVLRQSAERVRTDAINKLDHAIRKTLDDPKCAGYKDQLTFLRNEVQGISDGAFRPFTQQPLVRAAFTAISSLSGLALLQYSSIFNL